MKGCDPCWGCLPALPSILVQLHFSLGTHSMLTSDLKMVTDAFQVVFSPYPSSNQEIKSSTSISYKKTDCLLSSLLIKSDLCLQMW